MTEDESWVTRQSPESLGFAPGLEVARRWYNNANELGRKRPGEKLVMGARSFTILKPRSSSLSASSYPVGRSRAAVDHLGPIRHLLRGQPAYCRTESISAQRWPSAQCRDDAAAPSRHLLSSRDRKALRCASQRGTVSGHGSGISESTAAAASGWTQRNQSPGRWLNPRLGGLKGQPRSAGTQQQGMPPTALGSLAHGDHHPRLDGL
jgi:hypothetical protein